MNRCGSVVLELDNHLPWQVAALAARNENFESLARGHRQLDTTFGSVEAGQLGPPLPAPVGAAFPAAHVFAIAGHGDRTGLELCRYDYLELPDVGVRSTHRCTRICRATPKADRGRQQP